MIFVHRGSSPNIKGCPLLSGETAPELLRVLRGVVHGLTSRERDTLVRILEKLPAVPATEITLHADGTIYRVVHNGEPAPPEPQPGPEEDRSWIPTERGAALVVGDRDERCVRLSHVFEFLGFKSAAVVTDDPRAIAERVTAERPEVVVVGQRSWLAEDGRLVEVVAAEAAGLVTLGFKHDSKRGEVTDAVLDLPLQVRRIAPVLDPVIARVKSLRLERLRR